MNKFDYQSILDRVVRILYFYRMEKKIIDSRVVYYLEYLSKLIAIIVCFGILLASVLIIVDTFQVLFANDIDKAIQDGLFVLILLEMFYVTRSFIKYGSINVGLVVNVGIIAAVKELVFRMNSLNLELAIAFGVIFLTLSAVYLAETLHFQNKK
jgi:uncharacterized membrane protein (DUF373 family)